MKNLLVSYWFWGAILAVFISIILWDEKIGEGVKNAYVRHQMTMKNVNFSQVEGGFEHARMYADMCDMDDNQNNMNATNIRTQFFKENVATWSGILLAERGLKNPFEAKFWGNVRGWNTDGERLKTEELRYYFNRKELHTQKPVTIWKNEAVLTGIGMSYNTKTKEATINQQVLIRIWNQNASQTANSAKAESISTLPVAPPLSQILIPLKQTTTTSSATETRMTQE
ncbi:MAG: LPS export ABC transporter periplasmic protein LptC [Erysipelotrichia bacterium]|nr:LPS export ABC transporter periplasmic protein LptC [Erysipelotrichia bacterium]